MQLKHKASMPMLQSFLCRQNLSLCLSTDLQFWLGLPLLLFSSWVVSDSLQPHRLSSTRLLCPWDFSGKHSGVGCHFLLHCLFGKIHDNCCSSQKTAETRSWNKSRTRRNYPRNLVNFRMESRSFKGDRCDIHIDFLDFTSQRVWKEDLSSSDRISTDNPRDGWTLVVFSPSIPLLIEVPGPGPLLCLGMTLVFGSLAVL